MNSNSIKRKIVRATAIGLGGFFGSVILCVSAYAIWWHWSQALGEEDMLQLLNGSTKVTIASFEVTGQRRRVTCTDSGVANELSRMCRSSEWYMGGGTYYQVRFTLSTGHKWLGVAFFSDDVVALAIPGNSEDYAFHNVRIGDDASDRLQETMSFLNMKFRELPGDTMSVDDEGVRYASQDTN
ncbi:MAG: hypothetical protein R3C18_22015 [Planctomycetaceae bacterium]